MRRIRSTAATYSGPRIRVRISPADSPADLTAERSRNAVLRSPTAIPINRYTANRPKTTRRMAGEYIRPYLSGRRLRSNAAGLSSVNSLKGEQNMRSQMKLLSLMVRATVVLLTSGAFLVVLGIFDDLLDWDIF